MEQEWSHSKRLAPATHEMGHGGRKHVLTVGWSDWNWDLTLGMGKYNLICVQSDHQLTVFAGVRLLKDLKDAMKYSVVSAEALADVAASYKPEMIKHWKDQQRLFHLDPVRYKDHNVYREPKPGMSSA
jgi:hypothetical protein